MLQINWTDGHTIHTVADPEIFLRGGPNDIQLKIAYKTYFITFLLNFCTYVILKYSLKHKN